MSIRVADQLVERVTEDQGKIVVTTTITLDKGALTSSAGEMEPPLAVPSSAREVAKQGDMTVVQVAPKTFLCFVGGRRRPRPLCIDDSLFIFVSRRHSLADMAEIVAELMQQLPADLRWTPQDRSQRAEEILRALASHQP